MNVSGLGSFSLDGVIYRFEALNPLEAMRFGNRVFKVFGPALLSLASAKKDGGEMAGEGVLASLAPARWMRTRCPFLSRRPSGAATRRRTKPCATRSFSTAGSWSTLISSMARGCSPSGIW